MLEEDGYEVLYFYYSLEGTDMEGGSIEMKSLGSRNEQVWGGLFALSSVYPNSLRYTIIILEPTQECWYDISGELYDAYTGKGELTLNGEVIDVTTAFQLINYQIDELAFCE